MTCFLTVPDPLGWPHLHRRPMGAWSLCGPAGQGRGCTGTFCPPGWDVMGRVKGLAVVPVNTVVVMAVERLCTARLCTGVSWESKILCSRRRRAAWLLLARCAELAAEINSAAPRSARIRRSGRRSNAYRERLGVARSLCQRERPRASLRDPTAQRHVATCHKMQNPRSGVVGPLRVSV